MKNVIFGQVWDRRIHLNDIHPDMILYPVFSVYGKSATVREEVRVLSFPYKKEESSSILANSWRFNVSRHISNCAFADDNNVKYEGRKAEQYNFHAFFADRDDAVACAELINTGNLGAYTDLADTLHRKHLRDRMDWID